MLETPNGSVGPQASHSASRRAKPPNAKVHQVSTGSSRFAMAANLTDLAPTWESEVPKATALLLTQVRSIDEDGNGVRREHRSLEYQGLFREACR